MVPRERPLLSLRDLTTEPHVLAEESPRKCPPLAHLHMDYTPSFPYSPRNLGHTIIRTVIPKYKIFAKVLTLFLQAPHVSLDLM